ncbi:head maturation protease, ClpP-related [Paracoccus sp. (in: a-proteobacteria)]|uniref:head maturation protease, ClpP-related n=1 Tax=Paracoccus sp. TaxID=267 RepID=UPI003A85DB11
MTILVDGEIVLYGFVGENYWDEGFTSAQVLDALAEIGPETDVTVRINSGGGYSHEGIAVYNALTRHKGRVRVEVDAIAASAASVIAMAGDDIVMRRGAEMMIHDPSGITYGTAADHEQAVRRLDRHAASMVDIYADQSGEDPGTIREDMKAELWLSGDEAVARGYATATDEDEAEDVAAFPYQIYARAPKRLTALAKQQDWRVEGFFRPMASAAKPKKHDKEIAPMASKPNPATTPPASAGDVKARIEAILDDEAAQGREGLARYLAFKTDMPADEAVAALKAAAAAAPQARDAEVPDPAWYQAIRSAAADLAQPVHRDAAGSQGTAALAASVGRINKKR